MPSALFGTRKITGDKIASATGTGVKGRVYRFFSNLGPGLITGAADDDPSGISTYSVAGAALAIRYSGPLSSLSL